MSGNAALLPCPVCSHAIFDSSEGLRDRLIHVSTNKIACPVCQEEVTGLDKLTIHLFSHVKIVGTNKYSTRDVGKDINLKNKTEISTSLCIQNKKARSSTVKNKTNISINTPMKYIKIFPKLPVISLNPVPVTISGNADIDDVHNVSNTFYVPAVKSESALVQPNTICNICGLQFVDVNILRMHRCIIHNIDDNCNTTITSHQCYMCPKKFKMRGSLMVHMRVAHLGFSSKNINKENGKETPATSEVNEENNKKVITFERSDNKQWQCDFCRKCFTTKYFLKKHKRLHTGETPYACSQCNKTFTFQQSYHKHLLYHNDEKPHICTYCGRAFKELSTLHNHQRIHTGEKPFSCETCGKSFRQRVSYLVHRRIHTGVMPYKCTACIKSFRYKVSQRTHKCQASPPGTVIRQTGEFIEKLKQKLPDVSCNNTNNNCATTNVFIQVSEDNVELVRNGAKLSLEDTEKDDFVLIHPSLHLEGGLESRENNGIERNVANFGDTNLKNITESISKDGNNDNNAPSPSDILKNLCLSPDNDSLKQCENNVSYHEFFKDLNEYLH